MTAILSVVLLSSMTQTAVEKPYPKKFAYIILFTSDNCLYCEKIKRSISSKPVIRQIKEYHGKKIYEINYGDKNSDKWFVKYKVTKVPTMIIVDENGNILRGAVGYMTAREVEHFLKPPLVKKKEKTFLIFGGVTVLRMVIIILAKLALFLLS